MSVDGVGGVGGIRPPDSEAVRRVPPDKGDVGPVGEDRAEFSSEGVRRSEAKEVAKSYASKFDELTRDAPDIREDKVARARELIRQGRMDTPERMKDAAARLLAEEAQLRPVIDHIRNAAQQEPPASPDGAEANQS